MLDKATGDKNWENFQTFLQDAHRKLCKKIQETTQKTSYHGMNAMMTHVLEDTDEALIIMALAAVSDMETIASQKRIVERLIETISTLTAQLSGTNRATKKGQFGKVGEQKACTE